MKHTTARLDEERLRQRIRSLLASVQTEADPYLLNRYRTIFRKEVSFFTRSYLAAYLLLLDGQGDREHGRKRSKDREAVRAEVLSEEETVRLFVSIGRSRKVYPREILGLIGAKAQVAKEDIGSIRILDNYSFVQVRKSAADAVIEALNNQSFRGRTLTVNYARARKEDGGAEKYDD